MSLTLRNPAFQEEVGKTIKADGSVMGFRNSDGIGRMLYIQACGPIPGNGGLHSVVLPQVKTSCKKCRELMKMFETENEAFRKLFNKNQR